ncbi:MAG TPA: ATP-binding protein [Gaiellaceae bacterium]|nr:ATP-binding protein [Gaiellaceae bacterium]
MRKEELERKAEVVELLLHAARRLGETLDPEHIYDTFHDVLADVVQHNGVVVSSYDDRDGLIRCEYAWVDGTSIDPTTLPPLQLNREGGGMQSRVIMSGEPLLENEVQERVKDPGGTYYEVDASGRIEKLPDAGPPRTRAAMMVPVKDEGRVVGVVQLMSDEQQYRPEDLEVTVGLVAQMAVAVRNAALQKEHRRLEAAEAAARAVAAEREQAAQVLDAVGDGIFLVDREGVVRLWNRAAQLMTGLRADAVQGRPIADAFGDWEALAGRIPVAEGRAVASSVTLPVEAAGRDLWLSFVAVRGADGVVYAFRDVTGERRLDEEKSEFIATISHELRTPMSAVYGAAETLLQRRDQLTAEQRQQLIEMIAAQAARLSQITAEVLLTSQLERGDVRLERRVVDVVNVADLVVQTMRPQLEPAASLELEVVSEARAAGDADRIQQVLVNLVDNAFKHGGPGPIVVRVESGNGAVRVSVSDRGPGIERGEQQRIFEKFYRAGPQLTREAGGTGLGLYISRELVRRMGGRLTVTSEPGAGATFVFDLPRA